MNAAQSTATRLNITETRVISLPERRDRIQNFARRIRKDPIGWPFPTPTIVDGVRESAPAWYQSNDGAWGCRQAHLNILHSAWARGIQATLVLEDDAVWAPTITQRWPLIAAQLPHDWDMFMLGGEHIAHPTPVSPHIVRCTNTRRTHAYIVRAKAIPLLIRTWQQARRHIDHSSPDFQAQARVYAVDPFLFGQDAGPSDISGNTSNDVRYWS